MAFYAVGFGTWNEWLGRDATPEEIQKWVEENPDKPVPEKLFVRTGHMHGSSAKAAGPFKTVREAWKMACKLQEGASMMADFPFIFEAGPQMKVSTVIRKVESLGCYGAEMKVLSEYDGYMKKRTAGGIHRIILKRPFDTDKDNEEWFGEDSWRIDVPSSIHARRRIRNQMRSKNAIKV